MAYYLSGDCEDYEAILVWRRVVRLLWVCWQNAVVAIKELEGAFRASSWFGFYAAERERGRLERNWVCCFWFNDLITAFELPISAIFGFVVFEGDGDLFCLGFFCSWSWQVLASTYAVQFMSVAPSDDCYWFEKSAMCPLTAISLLFSWVLLS